MSYLETMQLSYWIYPSSFKYWTPEWFQSKVEGLGFENFKWIENVYSDTQICICTKKDNVYITFRGTNSDADWDTNFQFKLIDCKFGRIHKGFWLDAESVYVRILLALQHHWEKNIIINGHSQGGGVAVATAVKMLEAKHEVHAVYTYGCPRTVDKKAAKYLDKNHSIFYRVVHNNDIVTRVPPALLGYKHFGKLIYFNRNGKLCKNITGWSRFWDRLMDKFDFGGEFVVDIADDHAPRNYLDLVKSLK